MSKTWRIILMLLLCSEVVFATTILFEPPKPIVSSSPNGEHYFTMLPKHKYSKEAYGISYKLQIGGASKVLWSVRGWYAYKVYLSNNGEYLVRMGNPPSLIGPIPLHLAVAFYKNGVELKSYSIADLAIDNSKVKKTMRHDFYWSIYDKRYPLCDKRSRLLPNRNIFYLKTMEGMEYLFSVRTGQILGWRPYK